MQKYFGVKLVEAVPAIRKGGKVYEYGQPIPKSMEPVEDGYKVIYRDGYESWCPKAEFERANLLVDDNKHLPSGISVGQTMVDDFIAKTETITMGDRTTVVRATLRNGFEIVESSACVDPANYSEEYGAKICMEHIKNKVWMLLGFLLQTAVNGATVARKGWNGKGQYIELAQKISYTNSKNEVINPNHENIGNKAIAFIGTSGVQLGWLASQADMLADDWTVKEV